MKSTELYGKVTAILDKKGWRKSYKDEDREFIFFDVEDVSYAVVKKDSGEDLDSLCIITAPESFSDDFIPQIYIKAMIVNNRHTCVRVAIHSHLFDEGMEGNLVGCEYHIPKSCVAEVSTAIEEGVAQLDAIYHDFLNEMGVDVEQTQDA